MLTLCDKYSLQLMHKRSDDQKRGRDTVIKQDIEIEGELLM